MDSLVSLLTSMFRTHTDYIVPQYVPSRRDWFAMHALQGLIAHYGISEDAETNASRAYELANAMIARGEKL